MLQVRPLSFVRRLPRPGGHVYAVTNINGTRTVPAYGKKAYATHDQLFTIEYRPNTSRWHLYTTSTTEVQKPNIATAFSDSGLPYMSFPRRIDAIEALEVFIQSLEVAA